MSPKGVVLLICICFTSISCKDSPKESHWEAATLKSAAGAPLHWGYPLVARCTIRYKAETGLIFGDCIEFYGKVYVDKARQECSLAANEDYSHDEQTFSTQLEPNQACPHTDMLGGVLLDSYGKEYISVKDARKTRVAVSGNATIETTPSEGLMIRWYKTTNPDAIKRKKDSPNWVEP